MKYIKLIAVVLLLTLNLMFYPISIYADETEENVDFDVVLSSENIKVGDMVTVIVSLNGYTGNSDAIRGLQVDITGVDTSILSVIEYATLIEDSTSPISNTASYNNERKRVRLVYAQINGTLPAPCTDVLKVVFRINSDLNEAGSITLPVTVKMQTLSDQQITLNSEFTINYSVDESTVTSVDISWGEMAFEYSDGIWNPQTHCYEGGGWSDGGSGYVTVKNSGESAAVAKFEYSTERSDISGSLKNESADIISEIELAAAQEETVYLSLSGKPSGPLDSAAIGKVIVMIGGD